jgi:MerR family transcriptional regulator, light-induced transcriptional regulator
MLRMHDFLIKKSLKTISVRMMAQSLVSTGYAARTLNVSSATVQRWVDDGKLKSRRTAGGHRRIPIAEVNRLLTALSENEAKNDRWLKALLSGCRMQIRALMFDARQRSSNWAEASEDISGALAMLGWEWQCGRCSVFEEHIATNSFMRAINGLAAEMPVISSAPTVLLMTLAGERHTLGLALAELICAEIGIRTIWVGEGPPVGELRQMLCALKPALCVVSVSSHMKPKSVREYQAAIAKASRNLKTRVIFAGSGRWQKKPGFLIVRSFLAFRESLEEFLATATS